MEKYEDILKLLMEAVSSQMGKQEAGEEQKENGIPVGVSNRHLHLSQEDQEVLFGKNYEMNRMKDLSQPGQYACKETVTLCGPKGAIERVRILGPVRKQTQVEILAGDCFKLGVAPMVRSSGELLGTPGVTLVGPKGSVMLTEGVIVAQRHIHMTPEDASHFGVTDGQIAAIEVPGPRGGIYRNVVIRANNASALECHVDTEEANAMQVNSLSKINIIND